MLFASCDNENSVNPQTEELGSATITGKLKVQLDTGDLDAVPDGIQVIVAIDARDLVLNPIAGVNYGERFYTATTQGGSYTVTVDGLPANRSVTADVRVEAFRYTFRSDGPDTDPVPATPTLDKSEELMKAAVEIATAIEIYAGGTFIEDHDY